jgi:hypothetical protein
MKAAAEPIWRAARGETPGWDIDFIDLAGQRIAVEVKGSAAGTFSSVELTANELEAAKREGKNYWLFLVSNCRSRRPKVQRLQDPARLIQEGRMKKTPIQYRVTFLKKLWGE